MPYVSTPTFGTAKTQLANRLDPSGVFWGLTELGAYIIESLRFWNCVAEFHRARCIFNTTTSQPFYDITSTASTGAGATNPPALVAPTITDRDLINAIQYHLMEPLTTNWAASTPAMTEMFTLDDITKAIQRRRDQWLLETGQVVAHTTVGVAPSTEGRVPLADTIIDVRRVAWRDSLGNYTTLWRQDERLASAYIPGWSQNFATPSSYSIVMTPKVSIQLIPPPNDIGTLDLLTVSTGAALTPTASASTLGIPDDFTPALKWGAIADLLGRDAQARDAARQQYAQGRWTEGLQIAAISGLVQAVQIAGVETIPGNLFSFDSFTPAWQGIAAGNTGTPTDFALAARNLVVVKPVPDAGPYAITLDLIRNAPVPTSDASILQIGSEQLDVILDYAEHLAAFKMSGGEFQATAPHYKRMMTLALDHNARLRAEARNFTIFKEQSDSEKRDRPRREAA